MSTRLAAAGRACRVLAVLVALLAAGCQPHPSPQAEDTPAGPRDSALQVASNGWHAAIVLPADRLPPGAIPEAADFPDARWLSFGWGDAAYFPAREATLGMTLRAAFLPTPAVVLVAGLRRPPEATWPGAEIVTLGVSRAEIRRLAGFLAASFDRNGRVRASPAAPGPEPYSRFYPATGSFHLFNTCNTWAARGLAAAGLPVTASGTITAGDLMAQLRGLAAHATGPRDGASRRD